MDRRQDVRTKAVFQSACIETEAASYAAILRNLSPSGAGFEGDIRARVGDQINIRWGNLEPTLATVRWLTQSGFGVDADLQLAFTEPHQAYRSVRIPVGLGARIYVNGRRAEGELINLSQGGAAIAISDQVQPGQLATVLCGAWTFESACIKWIDKGIAGVRLARPIRLPQFSKIVETGSRKKCMAA